MWDVFYSNYPRVYEILKLDPIQLNDLVQAIPLIAQYPAFVKQWQQHHMLETLLLEVHNTKMQHFILTRPILVEVAKHMCILLNDVKMYHEGQHL
jgi:hypothetical protein